MIHSALWLAHPSLRMQNVTRYSMISGRGSRWSLFTPLEAAILSLPLWWPFWTSRPETSTSHTLYFIYVIISTGMIDCALKAFVAIIQSRPFTVFPCRRCRFLIIAWIFFFVKLFSGFPGFTYHTRKKTCFFATVPKRIFSDWCGLFLSSESGWRMHIPAMHLMQER